jgi:tetratricopeptide (TPR) repeat protein
MKRFFLIPIFLCACNVLFAQNDSITSRDTIQLNYTIKKNLIPDYQRILNFIADITTAQNEVEEIISSQVKINKESRVFIDDKIIIENDLKPGADTNILLRADMDVVQYLNTFYTSYSRTEDPNIIVNILRISVLKKTTYFYYDVLFECNYSGTNSSGEKFNKFNRIAEVKLINDHGWHPFINSIRFAKSNEPDTTNIYKSIVKTETDVDKIISMYDDEKQRQAREDAKQIKLAIEDGDEFFEKGEYENAQKKYREARAINIFDKEPQEKIAKLKAAISKKKQEDLEKAERLKHIEELKKEVQRLRDNYDFQNAYLFCDSLIKDYNVADKEFLSLNNDLSEINASLTGIETSLENRILKEAVRNCDEKIAQAKNTIYKAEFCYRMALIYYTLAKAETKKIYEFLGLSINYSSKHHQNALKLRAEMYMADNDILHAVEDAAQLIYNESRNPENYLFRAKLYKKDNKSLKAIDDYGKAINYNTPDTTAYVEKSTLEYNNYKFSDAKKTASEGIEKTICYGMLYFNRGIANDKLKDYKAAGEDFIKAKQCGIENQQRTFINQISETYVSQGKTNFAKGALYDARNQFSNAILIDSNEHALYGRAGAYILLGKNDSAITDLDKLIRRRPDYPDAHGQRAIAYSNLKNFDQANSDFADETKRFSTNANAWYAKGNSEIIQDKFAEAASSFERAATIQPSDSAWYKACYSHYYNKNYNKSIEAGNKARELNENRFQIYYICGRAFYDKKQLKDAIKEFERALKLESRNEDLVFAYATALEANRDFISASQYYDQLSNSGTFKDTSTFRSGVCLVKTLNKENFTKATNKFDRYIINSNNSDKSEVFAWAAYTYLLMDAQKNADEFIDKSQKANPGNVMLLYVLACHNVKNSLYDDAFSSLDKAIPALKLQKNDLDDNPLLRPLRKNSATKARYEQMMNKYFK